MLFKKNDKSFKFYIFDVGKLRHIEITRLIKQNGGELQDKRCPPAILFTSRSRYSGDTHEPVFDIRYIYDCIKCEQLLDLMNYKLGDPGYYGCLMSIFVRGSNFCSISGHHDHCCTSTPIKSKEEGSTINNRHSYAQKDYANVGSTDTLFDVRPPAPSLTPILSKMTFPPNETTQSFEELQFSPNKMPQTEKFTLSMSVKKSKSAPNRSSQDFKSSQMLQGKDFKSKGSTKNLRFSPNGFLQYSQLTLDRMPQTQDFAPDSMTTSQSSPDQSSQDTQFTFSEMPRVKDFKANGSTKNSQFSSDALLQDAQLTCNRIPQTQDFAPDSMTTLQSSPDQSSQDTQFTFSEMPQAKDFECNESTNDSQFSPYEKLQDSQFTCNQMPQAQDFMPSDSTTNLRSSRYRSAQATRTRSSVIKGTIEVNSNKSSDDDLSLDDEDSTPFEERKISSKKKLPPKLRMSRNFQRWESCLMMRYLIEKNMISEGKGLVVWRNMLAEGHLTHRTEQSLNNHFRRHILPNLDGFHMETVVRKQFRKLVH